MMRCWPWRKILPQISSDENCDRTGKSAIAVARQFGRRQRNFNGERFWARGYAVSTVGFEEAQICAYIKHQEQLNAQGADEPGEF